jgi:hypothetical protein
MTDATRVLTIRHQLHPARRRKRFIRGRRMMGGCLLVVAPLGWLFPQFVSGLEPSFHQSVVSEWNNNHPIEWWLDDTTPARSNGRRLKRATVEEVICQEKEACSLCTATDKELIAECAKTGKIKTLSCRKRGTCVYRCYGFLYGPPTPQWEYIYANDSNTHSLIIVGILSFSCCENKMMLIQVQIRKMKRTSNLPVKRFIKVVNAQRKMNNF